MSVAIGLYVYVVIGLIIATAMDRYFMREEVPYGWAPALPLATLRTGIIIALTITWPAMVYFAMSAIVGRIWRVLKAARRARRIYGHRS
jgi:hypothetical protein